MNGQAVTLSPGTRLVYDGDLAGVAGLSATQVVVRNDRTAGYVTVKLSRLVALARPADPRRRRRTCCRWRRPGTG